MSSIVWTPAELSDEIEDSDESEHEALEGLLEFQEEPQDSEEDLQDQLQYHFPWRRKSASASTSTVVRQKQLLQASDREGKQSFSEPLRNECAVSAARVVLPSKRSGEPLSVESSKRLQSLDPRIDDDGIEASPMLTWISSGSSSGSCGAMTTSGESEDSISGSDEPREEEEQDSPSPEQISLSQAMQQVVSVALGDPDAPRPTRDTLAGERRTREILELEEYDIDCAQAQRPKKMKVLDALKSFVLKVQGRPQVRCVMVRALLVGLAGRHLTMMAV
jgi:hypothetical protein